MAFPGKLLTLSIKTQIISTVVVMSIIAVLLISAIINLCIYELKDESLNNYINYYYTLQKEIFQNIISFQNFFIFNYEDTIKILIYQMAILIDISDYFGLYDLQFSFQHLNYSNFTFSFPFNDSNISDNNSNISDFDSGSISSTIYYFNDEDKINTDSENENYLKLTFLITNAFKSFRIPYYGDSELFEEIVIYLNKTKTIYSSNNMFLNEFIQGEIGGVNLNNYYINLKENISNILHLNLEKILNDKTIYSELTLSKEILDLLNIYKINKNIKFFAKYAPYIDYQKQFLHIIKIDEDNKEFYITAKLKPPLIDEISFKIMEFFNVTSILINPEDDTAINFISCQAMGIKLSFNKLEQNRNDYFLKFDETIFQNKKNFLNKDMTIDKCIIDSDNKEQKENYINYIKQKNSFFYDLDNGFNTSFIQLSDDKINKEYMVTRYTYPDFFILEKKISRYLIVNYLNVYSFMNFHFPYSYVDDKAQFLLLNFYAISLANWELWLILFIIIFLLCLKISNEITEPLIKLKTAIEQMSFNDEKIFEYKDDDNINELFTMCKELVNKDEFKKSLKENTFKSENQLFNDNEDKNYLGGMDNNEISSIIRRGANRNLILNTQLFEKSRNNLDQENKVSFDKEIFVYKDFKFLLKSRPRNQSRKRPKTINKLINKNFDLMPLKNYNRFKTKGDYNINSKIRDNFLRESMISNQTRKDNKISYDSKVMKEKANKNDNELNILLYELLFILGKNMFKPMDKDKKGRLNKYLKSDRSLISYNDINSGFDSTKNVKVMEEHKFYNYTDNIYENNDNSDIIYEEIKSISELNKENSDYVLKEEYQIYFKKNDLYYKYLKAKNNWSNKFLKQFRNAHDLEMDSNAMVELDEEDYNTSLLPRKNLRRNEFYKSTSSFKSTGTKNESIKSIRVSNLKKSIIKNKNSKIDKPKVALRKSITMPIKIFGTQITNPRQRKLGMRASVSANTKNLKVSLTKKTKFSIDTKFNQ